ncbi:MAG: EFR1 family ferrodoxin [Thermodesulfobacteriota bacterium]
MASEHIKATIVYCSPGGSTLNVAQVIKKGLEGDAAEVTMVDLAAKKEPGAAGAGPEDGARILFVGSPVYGGHAIPPVMDWLAEVDGASFDYAVPFVTYGGVMSGVAIQEMAEVMEEKEMVVLGAAKIVGEHTMMWEVDDPLGKGCPGGAEDAMVANLVTTVLAKMNKGTADDLAVSPSVLRYQPEEIYEHHKTFNLALIKPQAPKRIVNEELCGECQVCAEHCPTDAITFAPYPEFGDDCIICYNCVKECPEKAIEVDMTPAHGYIRARATQFDEGAESKIYV